MKPARILIVEDEPVVSLEIFERLQALGFEPTGRAMTGEEALAAAGEQCPDLVLMDIHLGGEMDGIETAVAIRRTCRTPVVFLTAYSEDETLDRAKRAEPYGYILKPFEDRDLKTSIEMALSRHGSDLEIRRLNRLYDVLSQVNQTIVRVQSPEELFQAVCRLLVERGEVDLAWIGRFDAASFRIEPVEYFGEDRGFLRKAGFYADEWPERWGTPGKAVREGMPSVCNECGDTACPYPRSVKPGQFAFQSCGSFPLRFQGTIWGTLNIAVSDPGYFRSREIHLLEETAMDISFALDKIEGDARRKEVEELALRQNSVLSGINRIFREALSTHGEEELGGKCIAVAEELTGSPMGFMAKLSAEGWLKDIAMSDGAMAACNVTDSTGHRLRLTDTEVRSIYGSVIQRGKAFYTNDPPNHPDSIGLPPGHPPLKAFLGAPLKSEDRTLGMIALGNRVDGYGSEQILALESIVPAIVESFSRKQAERELAKSKAQFQAIFNSISDAIVFTDTDRNILLVNPAFTAMFGYEAEEVLGRSTESFYPDSRAYEQAGRGHFHLGDFPDGSLFEAVFRHKNGSLIPTESVAVQVKDARGKIVGLLGVHRDITQRKKMEEERAFVEAQLRQAQKMEALGTLAGGIAHDFNNILGIIMGYTEMALMEMDGKVKGDFQEVIKASHRARDLVSQILAFSRQTEQEMRPLQIGPIVKEAVKMLRAALPSTIEIKCHVNSEASILGDPSRIHQVLMNLCTNAAHAMQEAGGTLEVRLEDVYYDAGSIPPNSGLRPGAYVRLTVGDTGHGIDPAVRERIFDPFFTTKGQGVGTGLGLSVVHGIVHSHGGTVQVESLPGRGATFSVFLPVSDEIERTSPANSISLPGGTERVLVVDDEPALAKAMSLMLQKLGYEVTVKTSGAEALKAVLEQPEDQRFDLVITDLTMPHVTGLELAGELVRLDPPPAILLCTGFSDRLDPEKVKPLGIQGFLMKPMELQDLAGTVRNILDERRGR